MGLQAEATGERTVAKEEVRITLTNIQVEKKPHPGHMALPADLPREIITIKSQADTNDLKMIGEEITEQLEVTPSKFFVRRFVRPKYALKPCYLLHRCLVTPTPAPPQGLVSASIFLLNEIGVTVTQLNFASVLLTVLRLDNF